MKRKTWNFHMKILVLIKFHNFCHFFKFQEKSVDQEPSIFQYWHLLTWNFRGHLFRTVHHVKLDFRVEVGPGEWFVYFMMYFKPLLPRKQKTLKTENTGSFPRKAAQVEKLQCKCILTVCDLSDLSHLFVSSSLHPHSSQAAVFAIQSWQVLVLLVLGMTQDYTKYIYI